jgi:hypothetical protein
LVVFGAAAIVVAAACGPPPPPASPPPSAPKLSSPLHLQLPGHTADSTYRVGAGWLGGGWAQRTSDGSRCTLREGGVVAAGTQAGGYLNNPAYFGSTTYTGVYECGSGVLTGWRVPTAFAVGDQLERAVAATPVAGSVKKVYRFAPATAFPVGNVYQEGGFWRLNSDFDQYPCTVNTGRNLTKIGAYGSYVILAYAHASAPRAPDCFWNYGASEYDYRDYAIVMSVADWNRL